MKKEKGNMLIAFILPLFITLLVLFYLDYVIERTKNFRNKVQQEQAFQLAEAGVDKAVNYLFGTPKQADYGAYGYLVIHEDDLSGVTASSAAVWDMLTGEGYVINIDDPPAPIGAMRTGFITDRFRVLQHPFEMNWTFDIPDAEKDAVYYMLWTACRTFPGPITETFSTGSYTVTMSLPRDNDNRVNVIKIQSVGTVGGTMKTITRNFKASFERASGFERAILTQNMGSLEVTGSDVFISTVVESSGDILLDTVGAPGGDAANRLKVYWTDSTSILSTEARTWTRGWIPPASPYQVITGADKYVYHINPTTGPIDPDAHGSYGAVTIDTSFYQKCIDIATSEPVIKVFPSDFDLPDYATYLNPDVGIVTLEGSTIPFEVRASITNGGVVVIGGALDLKVANVDPQTTIIADGPITIDNVKFYQDCTIYSNTSITVKGNSDIVSANLLAPMVNLQRGTIKGCVLSWKREGPATMSAKFFGGLIELATYDASSGGKPEKFTVNKGFIINYPAIFGIQPAAPPGLHAPDHPIWVKKGVFQLD